MRSGSANVIVMPKGYFAADYHWGHDIEMLEKIVGYRVSPLLRRGVDPLMGDSRHRRWLIPGVAEPPVYTSSQF